MNRKDNYKNKDKYIKTCRKQRRRYYHKTQNYKPRPWTEAEDLIVLTHGLTDHEISDKIQRSVMAIQIRRSRLAKAMKTN